METWNDPHQFDRLPVAGVFGQLRTALRHHLSAVLVAPPGAGKTTTVPLVLLEEPWLAGRRILLLAPRRMAARAAARRMAALLRQTVGATVGYRIRMESRTGPDTRIEVVTEGVLTRMLQQDPSLAGTGLVIFDEFHERSLEADLGLGLCCDIQGVFNEDLRLLVMSATLEPAPVVDLLDGAPLIRCEGRIFPVETRYVDRPATRPLEPTVAGVIRRSAAADAGDLLAFLPGAKEIRRTARLLENDGLPAEWRVVPLHGRLPRQLQDAAIAPSPAGCHKIVLATSIAETSLTIEGIGVVVDSGLQRRPRFDPVSGMTRLVTVPVSRASADQRRGRAGRLGPGICYRLWREAAGHALAPNNRPEILDVDLTGLALELAAWGLSDTAMLRWLDPPPAAAFAQARRLLSDLGALDENGKISAHGRLMADLPLHPRLAHMILAARQADMAAAACEIAAVLSERDPLHFFGRERDVDLKLRLDALQAHKAGQDYHLPGCSVNSSILRQIRKVSAGLQRRLGLRNRPQAASDAGVLLAWAYPDRIARRRSGRPGRYLLVNGRGAFLDPAEPLCANEYLVAAHLDGDRREARIFMAAATDRERLMDQFSHWLKWREQVAWDPQRRAVSASRRLELGALALASEILNPPPSESVLAAMLAGIREGGIDILPWTRSLRSWQGRVMLLARIESPGGPWPDISDAALTDSLEVWLPPYLFGLTRLKDFSTQDFSNALQALLNRRQRRRVEELAPTHITVPSGSRLPIDYSGPTPVLAVRIQEMFGASTTPAIADGRMPVILHLLSPAGRPMQITTDLPGFWKSSYPEVKKALKGRYPKHAWPDDPLSAAPTARTKARGAGTMRPPNT